MLRICLLAFSCLGFLFCFGRPVWADDGELVFVLKGRGNVFWQVINLGVKETAETLKAKAVLYNTEDDQSPEAQLNICLAALARKPKVLVMGAATKAIGIECYKKAHAAGVLVADIDGNVTIEDARAAGIPMAFSVGSDNYQIGRLAAQHIAKIFKSDTPRILVLKGLPGSIVSENRARGALDGLHELMPRATVVGIHTTDWDRMKSMNITLDVLNREPQLDVVFSASDVMSLGVVEAMRVAKRSGVIIVSVDGIKDGRSAILAGRMDAAVAQLPYLMGKMAVELALGAAAGTVHDKTEYIPTPVLTREVLEKGEDPLLSYLR